MGYFKTKILRLSNYSAVTIILTLLGLPLLLVFNTESVTTSINPKLSVQTTRKQEVQWSTTIGEADGDSANSLVQTAEGGFALAGSTRSSYGAGGYDMWLVKTGSTGEVEWNVAFGGARNEQAYSLVQTADGGFALAGSTRSSYGPGYDDMLLVKTDSTGVVEWNTTFGGAGYDWALSLVQTADGGFALAGDTESYGAGSADMLLVKTDSTGIVEWNATFGGAHFDRANSLVQTADGGFALAGLTDSYGAGYQDMWLVKTDSTGIAEWNVTFGGAGAEFANSLVQTADGGFALAGYTYSYGAGGGDMWLVKTDSTGIAEWNVAFGGAGYDVANSLVRTADGGFALAGYTTPYGADYDDIWLVKTIKGTEKDVSGITLDIVIIFLLLGGGLIAAKRR